MDLDQLKIGIISLLKDKYNHIIITHHKKKKFTPFVNVSFVVFNDETFEFSYIRKGMIDEKDFFKNAFDLPQLSLSQLIGYEVLSDGNVLEKQKQPFGVLTSDNFLFSKVQSLALLFSSPTIEFSDHKYVVRLFIDTIRGASIFVDCDTFELVYLLLNTFSLLEMKMTKNK